MPIKKGSAIVIAIPTNGRPFCLKESLSSIDNNVTLDCEVVILDSTQEGHGDDIKSEYSAVYNNYDVTVLYRAENTAPGSARKQLSEYIIENLPAASYMLYLDDDASVYPGAIETMKSVIDNDKCDIVSGIWEEKPKRRPIGFVYTFGEDSDGKYVLKSAVRWKNVKSDDLIYFDDVMPSLFAKIDIHRKVTFDDRYDFYFDVFDFFMECRKNNIKIATHGGARFFHNPKKYRSKSMRQVHDVNVDKEKFIKKWGVRPIIVSMDESMSFKVAMSRIYYKFIRPK